MQKNCSDSQTPEDCPMCVNDFPISAGVTLPFTDAQVSKMLMIATTTDFMMNGSLSHRAPQRTDVINETAWLFRFFWSTAGDVDWVV